MSIIQTFSGKYVDLMDLKESDISIKDIAHSLSMQCRFNGHSKEFFSVAQHCALVSYFCGDDALQGLLHDASEAYLSDLPRPLKMSGMINGYLDVEEKVQHLIYSKFGVSTDESYLVKEADLLCLKIEAKSFMNYSSEWNLKFSVPSIDIIPLSQEAAKQQFIDRFKELCPNYEFYEKLL